MSHFYSQRARLMTLGILAQCALIGGCGLKGEDLSPEGQAIVNDATESDVTLGIASAIIALPSLALTGSEMSLAPAVAKQKELAKFAQPSGCLTTTTQGNVVTYAFDQCTGPWGLVQVTGEEVATFSAGDKPGVIVVDLASQNLQVNGRAADLSAHMQVSFAGTSRTVDWDGSFSGFSMAGRHIKSTSSLTLLTDPGNCITVNGTASTQLGLRGLTASYEDLKRCGPLKTCPTGTIVGTGAASKYKVTLTFDGTTEGLATGRLGSEKSFTIDCTPAKP